MPKLISLSKHFKGLDLYRLRGLNDWRLFPVCNQSLIHILQAFEWQFATLDYMRMIEAGIGCKEYAVYIESAIHFLQTVLRQLQ